MVKSPRLTPKIMLESQEYCSMLLLTSFVSLHKSSVW